MHQPFPIVVSIFRLNFPVSNKEFGMSFLYKLRIMLFTFPSCDNTHKQYADNDDFQEKFKIP